MNPKTYKFFIIAVVSVLFILACMILLNPKDKLVTNPDNYPVFPGCESHSDKPQMKRCFSNKVNRFIRKKFNTNLAAENELEGSLRSKIQFHIKSNGDFHLVNIETPHPLIEMELRRIFSEFPKVTPAVHEGEKVTMPFSLPFRFITH